MTAVQRGPVIGPIGSGPADLRIVSAIGRGDADALAAAYGAHGRAVYAEAGRICGRELAQDAVQEVFIALWHNPATFDARRGSLRTFLLVQARARAVDLLRSMSARERREWRWSTEGLRSQPHAENEPLAGAMREEVRDALRALTEHERAALVLAYFGGYTYREVALLLQEPEGTVKSRIRTGLHRMRASLDVVDDDLPQPVRPAPSVA